MKIVLQLIQLAGIKLRKLKNRKNELHETTGDPDLRPGLAINMGKTNESYGGTIKWK